MSRMNTSRLHTRSKHEHTMDALWSMLADMRRLLESGEAMNSVQAQGWVNTLIASRVDLVRCARPEWLKEVAPDDHRILIANVTALRARLEHNLLPDLALLTLLDDGVRDLENCREDMGRVTRTYVR